MRYSRIDLMVDGDRMEYPQCILDIPTILASSAGPDLREIVMGSEGRFGVLTEVKVRVTPLPEKEQFHVAFAPSWTIAVQLVRSMAQAKLPLSMLRLSNAEETRSHLKLRSEERRVGKSGDLTGCHDLRNED